ncbi:hypothetical protein MNBD_UNCLBAC01-408 [hydrothermal vent metagenome]|uniref:PIN domain-containing protein n=1 Tax=hydrothermal vent metagenome TaxID=652676 RepID=A0A3B1DGC0_9ZZZZ
MNLIVDTSTIIAVITNEKEKKEIIHATKGYSLLAPSSVHWEIANAFSAMLKRERITYNQAKKSLNFYQKIPIRFCDITLEDSLKLANELNIYAYDAYILCCATKLHAPIISLDKKLIQLAKFKELPILEVT